MSTPRTALVVGARGGIGGAVARSLLRHGWRVRGLARRPAGDVPGMEWIAGDAMDRAAVVRAAQGVQAVIHAVNPPGYRNWGTLVLPMLDNSMAAALAAGARLVLPGTVYNFGPDAFADPGEDAPQRPLTRKGAIRVEMERRLRDAVPAGLRSLVVRAGDYFGPGAASNWFAQGLVGGRRPVRGLTDPGRPGVGHQWAYLPDVAETIARLLAREDDLDPAARFHLAGHWDADGTEMIAAIRRALGRPSLPVRRFPWWLVSVARPFVPFCREMHEMRYLWRMPLRLTNGKLVRFLGDEPHTPLDVAVAAALGDLKQPLPEQGLCP
ncbi:NAD(P)H-binding protein [Gluconacetobacter azotocaptans]|uniref:NAD-dependent epimerase/dehydratase family protein n=1 Tax=Gluconacetobacter azotocaptans TaxID=142834 RepID=UPI001956F7B6|nr:NAD-dependent epimerase/dehydratase family protein [Gluconacetobacter azotocaptans]MBM9403725.1 NAD(P)H-binding protein [Gluconacetobacter azotocaptans]